MTRVVVNGEISIYNHSIIRYYSLIIEVFIIVKEKMSDAYS